MNTITELAVLGVVLSIYARACAPCCEDETPRKPLEIQFHMYGTNLVGFLGVIFASIHNHPVFVNVLVVINPLAFLAWRIFVTHRILSPIWIMITIFVVDIIMLAIKFA